MKAALTCRLDATSLPTPHDTPTNIGGQRGHTLSKIARLLSTTHSVSRWVPNDHTDVLLDAASGAHSVQEQTGRAAMAPMESAVVPGTPAVESNGEESSSF